MKPGLAIPTTGEDYLEMTKVLTKDDVFGFGDGWAKGFITNFPPVHHLRARR